MREKCMWLERYPSGAAVGVVTTIVNAVLYAETAALRNSLSTHLEKWILGGRLEGRCTAGEMMGRQSSEQIVQAESSTRYGGSNGREMYDRGDDGVMIIRTNSPSRRYGGNNNLLMLKLC
jgi:hypothetical protein